MVIGVRSTRFCKGDQIELAEKVKVSRRGEVITVEREHILTFGFHSAFKVAAMLEKVHALLTRPLNAQLDRAFTMQAAFYGEFGVASYPCCESVQRFLPAEETAATPPADGSFAYHTPIFNTAQRSPAANTNFAEFFTAGRTMESSSSARNWPRPGLPAAT